MARLEDLETIEQAVWAELARAPRDRGHGWRVGVLATTDGRSADARSIVLRDVDPVLRSLVFYADSRSPKVQQIQAFPAGTIVLWSQPLSWQLRLKVQLGVETAGLVVSSRWARLKMSPGAQDYLSPLPPGSAVDTPLPERGTREHFGVVTARIDAVDWLELHADGHRRAAFDDQGPRWLVP
jgi:pyridoxamine 5'-phosphate oxidase